MPQQRPRRGEDRRRHGPVGAAIVEPAQNSSQAAVVQAQASLNQNQVNLDHCIITAPIDGIVIQRSVDVGQTVAASMQAPTLFIIAADLTKMQVNANIDESDVGRIRPDQNVTFRVDAYPGEEFQGTVAQIRLQPVVVQNVTTYATIINVPNPELKLKPGMTANLRVQIARRADVVRMPNAAAPVPPDQRHVRGAQSARAAGGAGRRRGGRARTPAARAARRPQRRAPTRRTPAPAARPTRHQPRPRRRPARRAACGQAEGRARKRATAPRSRRAAAAAN